MELKDNSVELTEEGIALAETALETNDLWDENDPWARSVSLAYVVNVIITGCDKVCVDHQH